MAFQEALVLNNENFLMNMCASENLRCHHLEKTWMMQIIGIAAVTRCCCFVPGSLGLTFHCVGINNIPSTKLKPNFYFPFQKSNLLDGRI